MTTNTTNKKLYNLEIYRIYKKGIDALFSMASLPSTSKVHGNDKAA